MLGPHGEISHCPGMWSFLFWPQSTAASHLPLSYGSHTIPCLLGMSYAESSPWWPMHYLLPETLLNPREGVISPSVKLKVLVTQSCRTLCSPMDWGPSGLSFHGILQHEYQSGCPSLLQGIFPTQRSNPGPLHCRQILDHWSTWEDPNESSLGNQRILKDLWE